MQKIDVGALKINGSLLATDGMVIAAFQVFDKLGRFLFFQETFLLANISIEVVLGISFLIFSEADVQFAEKELTWRIYITEKAIPTTRCIKFIDQKEFLKAVLDENIEAFVVHISFLGSRITIHLAKKAQIALLLAEKVIFPAKHSDFADVFLEESANIVSERIGVNKYAIELKKGKQLPYRPIYSLKLVELKLLKTYIKINLANCFIRASKLAAGALILFVRKPNGSFCLCVNYWELNNLTIKNWYLLPLIGKSLDLLGRAKQFTQLDLISAYHWMRIKKGNK